MPINRLGTFHEPTPKHGKILARPMPGKSMPIADLRRIRNKKFRLPDRMIADKEIPCMEIRVIDAD
jgi:hypothetical protein